MAVGMGLGVVAAMSAVSDPLFIHTHTHTHNSSTCGWYTNDVSVAHGKSINTHLKDSSINDDLFVSTVDCDKRRLNVLFPYGEQREMEVNLLPS